MIVTASEGQRKVLDSLELKFQAVVSHLIWVLRTEKDPGLLTTEAPLHLPNDQLKSPENRILRNCIHHDPGSMSLGDYLKW